MKQNASVVILGGRGSTPVSGAQYQYYGQATTCFLVQSGSSRVVLDAGSFRLWPQHMAAGCCVRKRLRGTERADYPP